MAATRSRREFLADVGRGTLIASVGSALADRGICAPPDVAQAAAAYPILPATASEGASA